MTTAPFYMRFEDPALQSAFVQDLQRRRVPFLPGESGAVGYGPDNWLDVMDSANTVRDSQFPWYLIMCNTPELAGKIRQRLEQGGFPFFVEHSNAATSFGV